jgi:hypothetical protein
LDAHAGAVDYISDIVNEEVGQLCKDKDQTRTAGDTAVNGYGNVLLLQTETFQESKEKQTPTSFRLTPCFLSLVSIIHITVSFSPNIFTIDPIRTFSFHPFSFDLIRAKTMKTKSSHTHLGFSFIYK